MFIQNEAITDWQDLQAKVAQLFEEMDYEVETPRHVDLAGRGKKEVDVWVRDPLASINQIYLIECKFWNTKVPQDIVHGFKTVMEGAGANTGFIISKVGFQRGAYEAIRFTNIHLLTFEELQHRYGSEWFRKQKRRLEPLIIKLREAHHLHFDQFNGLPVHNNMFFHTEQLYEQLCYYHKLNINLSIIASGKDPESYLGPEPIESTNPFDPYVTWDTTGGKAPYTFLTVRQFFQNMTKAMESWITGFEALRKEAHESFEALSEGEQSDIMLRSMRASVEELPVRVLKRHLTTEEYQSALMKLGSYS